MIYFAAQNKLNRSKKNNACEKSVDFEYATGSVKMFNELGDVNMLIQSDNCLKTAEINVITDNGVILSKNRFTVQKLNVEQGCIKFEFRFCSRDKKDKHGNEITRKTNSQNISVEDDKCNGMFVVVNWMTTNGKMQFVISPPIMVFSKYNIKDQGQSICSIVSTNTFQCDVKQSTSDCVLSEYKNELMKQINNTFMESYIVHQIQSASMETLQEIVNDAMEALSNQITLSSSFSVQKFTRIDKIKQIFVRDKNKTILDTEITFADGRIEDTSYWKGDKRSVGQKKQLLTVDSSERKRKYCSLHIIDVGAEILAEFLLTRVHELVCESLYEVQTEQVVEVPTVKEDPYAYNNDDDVSSLSDHSLLSHTIWSSNTVARTSITQKQKRTVVISRSKRTRTNNANLFENSSYVAAESKESRSPRMTRKMTASIQSAAMPVTSNTMLPPRYSKRQKSNKVVADGVATLMTSPLSRTSKSTLVTPYISSTHLHSWPVELKSEPMSPSVETEYCYSQNDDDDYSMSDEGYRMERLKQEPLQYTNDNTTDLPATYDDFSVLLPSSQDWSCCMHNEDIDCKYILSHDLSSVFMHEDYLKTENCTDSVCESDSSGGNVFESRVDEDFEPFMLSQETVDSFWV